MTKTIYTKEDLAREIIKMMSKEQEAEYTLSDILDLCNHELIVFKRSEIECCDGC
jgi:hypothetical protein